MRMNASAADPPYIVGCGAKSDCLNDRRGACFETLRRGILGPAFCWDFLDHLAAAKERRQFVKPSRFPIEHTNAGRPVELVARHAIEVDIEAGDIDVEVNRAL